jgi:hypothetical protein
MAERPERVEDSSSGDRLWLKAGKSMGPPGWHLRWNA